MVEKQRQNVFLRKTRKLGNSCGVLLPKYLLGADVRVIVVKPPINPKKDVMLILEEFLEDILGVYFLEIKENKAEILAVSTTIREKIERSRYKIDIVPLETIRKSIKSHTELRDKLKKAKTIINKKLLSELKSG